MFAKHDSIAGDGVIGSVSVHMGTDSFATAGTKIAEQVGSRVSVA